jgi:hypothetical protein
LTTKRRILCGLAGYVLLVFCGGLYFAFVEFRFEDRPALKPLYALGGPSLSLFTDMSYFLFLAVSFLMLPWIFLWAASKRLRWLGGAGFAITWFLIGWRLAILF